MMQTRCQNIKRAFDLTVAAVGLLPALPVMALACAAIWIEDGGPVLFCQGRIGRWGRPFAMLKLRTMRRTPGPALTAQNDPRITRVGRVLRHTKIDELPQLFNVLMGEMSLVGPRPELPRYVAGYTPAQREVLRYRPGLTDPAALRFSGEERILAEAGHRAEAVYRREILPRKLKLSILYARHATPLSDLWMLWHTLRAVFGRGKP
jgi:lipopolysaccharide/colanic/teichoic acid biosynthesis glycosyltransferase